MVLGGTSLSKVRDKNPVFSLSRPQLTEQKSSRSDQTGALAQFIALNSFL